MPYIRQERRAEVSPNAYGVPGALSCGELNYQITELLNLYKDVNTLKYQTINDILGALEGAKLEFVRRVVNPYENAKMAENGDVYS